MKKNMWENPPRLKDLEPGTIVAKQRKRLDYKQISKAFNESWTLVCSVNPSDHEEIIQLSGKLQEIEAFPICLLFSIPDPDGGLENQCMEKDKWQCPMFSKETGCCYSEFDDFIEMGIEEPPSYIKDQYKALLIRMESIHRLVNNQSSAFQLWCLGMRGKKKPPPKVHVQPKIWILEKELKPEFDPYRASKRLKKKEKVPSYREITDHELFGHEKPQAILPQQNIDSLPPGRYVKEIYLNGRVIGHQYFTKTEDEHQVTEIVTEFNNNTTGEDIYLFYQTQ